MDERNGTGQCYCPSPWFIEVNHTCQCAPGYWGSSSPGQCPLCSDPNAICDDGLNGTGKCKCNGTSNIFKTIQINETMSMC